MILSDIFDRVRAVVVSAWPEVAANGVYEAEHVGLLPWEDLTPPYAVMAIERMPNVSYASVQDTWAPAVQVYYVAEIAGPSGPIVEKLSALEEALNAWDETLLSVVRVDEMAWSDALTPNQVFASKAMAHRAGRLMFTTLIAKNITTP